MIAAGSAQLSRRNGSRRYEGLESDVVAENGQQKEAVDEGRSEGAEETSPKPPVIEAKVEIIWNNVILMLILHLGALIGLRQCFTSAQWRTTLFAFIVYGINEIGVLGGAHRLWSHRSFKANLPLRLILAIMQTSAYQGSIYEWARDHRIHHKYSETNADPHNALRGFFFAHVGWILSRKHPDVKAKGKLTDLSDLEADPIVMFQHRHYYACMFPLCFILPTLIPYLYWKETLFNSFFVCVLLRYMISQHGTWFINSVAHMWGRRPYDKNINPSESRFVSLVSFGEGFHNYHHTFPWDYAASELGFDTNITKLFIDFFAFFGWAYDRKVVSPEMIRQRKLRTGDTTELGPYGPYN